MRWWQWTRALSRHHRHAGVRQFAKAYFHQKLRGLARFAAVQNH